MLKENKIYIHEFDNGIKLVFQNTGISTIANCGLLIGAGTRDEEKGKEGLAHFIEHTIFKGTENRTSIQIINRLEMVGGELNAFTSKEETCVYASFMKQYLDRAMQLIDDIVFNSIFPEKEIAKEKEVVLDEIRTYLDTPSDQIFDDFESMIFSHHSLGNPILGTTDSVSNFKRSDILKFVKQNYFTDRMVLSVTGDFKFEEVKAIATKYFSVRKKQLHNRNRKKFSRYKPQYRIVQKQTEQAHYITGSAAYSFNHPQRLALVLVNNILGGPALNSRLNLAIREKYGYTYNIESNYLAYSDTGVFNLYLATEKKYLERTIALAKKELEKFCAAPVSTVRLHQYREQLIGQVALAQENKSGIMLALSRSLLNYGKVETLENVYAKIRKVTPMQVLETSNQIFDKNNLSSLLFTNA